MQCIMTVKQSNKITHYDETKKRTHDWQIVRAKENLKLNHGGPSQRQEPGTNQRIKLYVMAVIEAEVWPTVVQLNNKP